MSVQSHLSTCSLLTTYAKPGHWVVAALLRTSRSGLLALSLMALATATQADAPVHPDVQRALDYRLPEDPCVAPAPRRTNQNPGQAEHFERQQKSYLRCIEDHQKKLFSDFQFMQASVQHGVTMPQAATIKDHLELIAATIKQLKLKGAESQQRWLRASGERARGTPGGGGTGAADNRLSDHGTGP